MPLDDTEHAAALVRRRQLIEALRAEPEDWDFGCLGHCAMGLAHRMGLWDYDDTPTAGAVLCGRAIGISDIAAHRIFYGYAYDRRPVTAAMVANALERQ